MDRSAIVTGGTGGLGSAVVARLLNDGWRVVVPWIVEQELERVEQRAGLELIQADLSNPEAVSAVTDAASQQAALPYLVQGGAGSIVCVGTRAAVQPFPGAAGYISSKAAVIAFAQAVATEYKNDGVRCNVILPSVIDTPGNRVSMPNADYSRWVKPAEIAGVIAHLLSSDSTPINGATIPVYGRA
jgi:NAD(P)-dependent dehydrogenase (short-subunit alcohol dehydrogenase family)